MSLRKIITLLLASILSLLDAQIKVPTPQVKLPIPDVQKQMEAAKSQMTAPLSAALFGRLQEDIKKSQETATPLDLQKNIPQLFTKIPGIIKQAFNNAFSLINIRIEEKPTIPSVKCGIYTCDGRASLMGTLRMGSLSVEAILKVYEDSYKNNHYSLTIQLPQTYQLSQIIPSLSILNRFRLPQSRFVISDFSYTDNDGVSIAEGANFVSLVDLSGPMYLFGQIKNKAKDLRSIIVDMAKPIQLVGAIPASLDSFSFKIVVPIRFGIDFKQIREIPSGFSDFLRQITTDDFVVKLTIKALEQIVAVQNGIRIAIGTQRDPIVLQAFGTLDLTSGKFSFGGKMPSMIDLVWLAIGDLGVEFFVDPSIEAVLAAFGVPISGIGLRGRIEVGKTDRASLEVWTKVSLEAKKAIDAIFYVSGTNLNFSNLIYMLAQMAAKANITAPIPVDAIPTIKLNRLSGRLAPWDGEVAGKSIEAGFALEIDATLFDQNFGFFVDIKHKELQMTGQGWMPPIKLELGGKTVFQFTGAGKDLKWNTPDDGPYIHFDFNAKKPLEGSFALSGMFEMPALALKQQVDILFARHHYQATIESSAIGFTVRYAINIDPVKWREMFVEFSFKDDFERFISQQAKPALEDLKREASVEFSKADKAFNDAAAALRQLGSQGVSDAQREINNTRARISQLESQIRSLNRECDNASALAKIPTCIRVAAELTAPGAELAAKKIYLEGLLKPGQQVIQATTGALANANKAVADAEIFKKSAQGILDGINQALDGISKGVSIFKLKEATGRISAQDIAAGKLSLIKKLVVEVNIPNQKKTTVTLNDVTFDFKNAAKSVQDMVKKMLQEAVKIK